VKRIGSKLPKTGTTIFTVMTQLAERHRAINLAQGFPDFQPPARLQDLVGQHLRAGHNQYPPMTGVQRLREAIARKILDVYRTTVDADSQITVTSGATEALFCAVQAIVRPGDEVIVFDPAYDSYGPAVTLAGGRTTHLPLRTPAFTIDWDRLETSLTERTRLLIINSPHNPTGALIDGADLNRLAELLRPYDCFVLSDEVYEHIVYDGCAHASALAHAELAQRAFTVSSFGKTYHATGWKVGYCVAPRELAEEFRRIHQYVTFAAVAPIQHALADYLDEAPEHYRGLPAFYQAKRDHFASLLADSKFELLPARGTYFQLADYSAVADLDDVEFARWLTIEHGVATIPISVFYDAGSNGRLVRFCFAKEAQTLDAAAARLQAL
jgi:methionine aminotransferase